MSSIDVNSLEAIIRKIVMEQLGNSLAGGDKHLDKSGILSVKLNNIALDKFETGNQEDSVYLKDVITLEESPRLGCGLMEMTESCFKWTLKYDEIDYIIDGQLEIKIDGRSVIGSKGDMIFIPKNSTIEFSAPDFARFMYVTYPANWAEI